ncbi:hypothetical protein L209DRAFT_758692 [Thermothelomyces heterothallicus CBS 203.75]
MVKPFKNCVRDSAIGSLAHAPVRTSTSFALMCAVPSGMMLGIREPLRRVMWGR